MKKNSSAKQNSKNTAKPKKPNVSTPVEYSVLIPSENEDEMCNSKEVEIVIPTTEKSMKKNSSTKQKSKNTDSKVDEERIRRNYLDDSKVDSDEERIRRNYLDDSDEEEKKKLCRRSK